MLRELGVDVAGMVGVSSLGASGTLLSPAQAFLNYLVDVQGVDVVWPLVNISSGNVVLANNSVYNGPAAGLVGWQLQNAPGPIAGTKAPFSDGVNDYGNIYSANLAALFDGGLFSWAIMWRAYTGVWDDGLNRYASVLGQNLGSEFAAMYKPTLTDTFRCRVEGNNNNHQINVTVDDYGWHLAWTTYNVSADRMRVGVDGTQYGGDISGIEAVAGLGTDNCLAGAANRTPSYVWYGWLAYLMFWASEKSVADMAAIAGWIS